MVTIWPWLATAQNYVEPNSPPPTGIPSGRPALEFLNGSSAIQRKVGSLLIGDQTGGDSLCLNGDPSLWTADDDNCIQSWMDVAGDIEWTFLRLLTLAEVSPPSPQLDQGFMVFRNNASQNQLISLLTEASETAPFGATGIRAISPSTQSYAAQFNGQSVIRRSSGLAQLCLNNDCITQWNEVVVAVPTDVVNLQATAQVTPDAGNVGINGPMLVGSLVVGNPNTVSVASNLCGQFGTLPCSCGDGLCSPGNGEDAINCSADCGP